MFEPQVIEGCAAIIEAAIVAGSLILLYGWYWTDTELTLMIAGYVLYQAETLLPKTIHILM